MKCFPSQQRQREHMIATIWLHHTSWKVWKSLNVLSCWTHHPTPLRHLLFFSFKRCITVKSSCCSARSNNESSVTWSLETRGQSAGSQYAICMQGPLRRVHMRITMMCVAFQGSDRKKYATRSHNRFMTYVWSNQCLCFYHIWVLVEKMRQNECKQSWALMTITINSNKCFLTKTWFCFFFLSQHACVTQTNRSQTSCAKWPQTLPVVFHSMSMSSFLG